MQSNFSNYGRAPAVSVCRGWSARRRQLESDRRLCRDGARRRHFSGDTGAERAKDALYANARAVEGPSIICIQDTDPHPIGSFWGEVQASIFRSLGSVGTLTAGGVRDIPASDTLGFAFLSTHVLVSHANIHVEAINCPVQICGLEIRPGDLLHADMHGFTVVPGEIVDRLAAACEAAAASEEPVIGPCREAIERGERPTIEDLRAWNAKMGAERQKLNF